MDTVKRTRKTGRQKKKWEANFKEWTGMDFASSIRAAEDMTKWKRIAVVICSAPTTTQRYETD